jgi:signal transduction histidine kinase
LSEPTLSFTPEQFAFLRKVCHDLHAPLNVVVASSELLLKDLYGELAPRQRQATERVFRNGLRAAEMLNRLMFFVRVQANSVILESLPVEIAPLLAELVQPHSGRTISVDIAPDFLPIHADRGHIRFLIDELLQNALLHTPEGEITIRVRSDEPDRWSLVMADNGMGIASDDLPNLFTPLWRGSYATTNAPQGLGLGLPLVLGLARLMQGSLEVQSEAGTGSIFTLTLPTTIPAQNP